MKLLRKPWIVTESDSIIALPLRGLTVVGCVAGKNVPTLTTSGVNVHHDPLPLPRQNYCVSRNWLQLFAPQSMAIPTCFDKDVG